MRNPRATRWTETVLAVTAWTILRYEKSSFGRTPHDTSYFFVLGLLFDGDAERCGLRLFIEQRWTAVIVFSLLILVLIFRPTGILAEQQSERA